MDVYQREEVLEDHRVWLESDEEKGRRADFSRMALDFIDLSKADLRRASFQGASLIGTDFREARLQGACLIAADLTDAKLQRAKLQYAELNSARIYKANLRGANLSGADLRVADLVKTDLRQANLTGCSVYGVSVWDVVMDDETVQADLVVTRQDQTVLTVDNLKLAQFLYLLLDNPEIRDVIDTITSRVVLILGRFTESRLSVLQALRAELRQHDYVPVLFDFDAPKSRDLEETVSTLAHMARFIIADITDPKAIPQELSTIVRNLQSVPVLPLLHDSGEPWGMFAAIKRRSTLLPILNYSSEAELIGKIQPDVIEVAERKVIELKP